MGNQQSTATAITDIVNKTATNVLISNSSSCGQNNSALQNVNFSNITTGEGCSLGITSSQASKQVPNFSCLSNTSQSAGLQSALSTKLKEAVQSETSNVGGAINSESTSYIKTNAINDITNNVSMSNLSTCLQNNLSTQDALFSSIKSSCPAICRNPNPTFSQYYSAADYNRSCTTNIGSTQDLVQAAIGSCIASNDAAVSAINKAATDIDHAVAAKNTGINLTELTTALGNALSSVVTATFLPFIIFGIVAVVLIYMFLNNHPEAVTEAITAAKA